jgi:hypothetical protein
MIRENELLGDSIKRTLKILGNSIERIQEFQEELYYDSSEEFLSYHDAPLPSSPSPSMTSKDE